MIQIQDRIIELHTKDTSYILSTLRGVPECLHYGARIKLHDAAPLINKADAGYGNDVLTSSTSPALSSLRLELSPTNRGDYRKGALLAEFPHGFTTEYSFDIATIAQGSAAPAGGMPMAHGGDNTLVLTMKDHSGLLVQLYYTVFYNANVITKKMRVTNQGAAPVALRRALSQQLDLPHANYVLYTLNGAWAREFHLHAHNLEPGLLQFGSSTGASGHRCNPFFFLAEPGASETAGDVYGFNLVYSGSHEASAEVDTHGRLRIMQGIWSDGFEWPLAPGESFVTPEAVLTFSAEGKTAMSHNMHHFVKQHILPKTWAAKPRPVLVNNWEGTYFNFNEAKLLGMARIAKKLGVELFVLDDGWFGDRNNDKAGLGDYNVNREKLPSGLKGLAAKMNRIGLDFGIWVEPEMANADSDLFRAHPDWIIQTPGYVPATGRHQYVLDLCRTEVQDYIIQSVNGVLQSANIKYVKWDMNRHITDNYSSALQKQGAFMHSYALGLYHVLENICARNPEVLFEGCASGGNRFDLGILSFMPQIWTSDDSDAHERQKIQTGASYGYPPCTMGCHVSAVPNHQTLRSTPLETRFNTAIFGLLGYELDMRHLTAQQRQDVTAQIAFYKKYRNLLQYGDFYRLHSPFEKQVGTSYCAWMVVDPDKGKAMVGDFMGLLRPNSAQVPLRMAGLAQNSLYKLNSRGQKIQIKTFGGLVNDILPMHVNPEGALVSLANKVYRLPTEKEEYTAYGSLLCQAGVQFVQDFTGSGYSEQMRFMEDYASRLYLLEKVARRNQE